MGTPTREIFFNLSSVWNKIFMYALFLLTIFYLFAILYRRLKFYGFKVEYTDLSTFLKNILFQTDLLKRKKTGWGHFFIYFGFLILVVATTSVFIDYDLGIKIYRGNYYLLITVLSDIAGLLIITLCSSFLYSRYILKEDSLVSFNWDWVLPLGLIVLCLQGFLLEGLRISLTNDEWQLYSFVGAAFSKLFNGLSQEALSNFHFANWWLHTITVFIFFALLPYTKAFHILTSPLNLLFKRDNAFSKYPNLISKLESGDLETVGYKSVLDLDFKNKLDLEACTSCGRCQEVCPAYLSEQPLSPKWLILHQRRVLRSVHSTVVPGKNLFYQLDDFLLSEMSNGIKSPSNNQALNCALKMNGLDLMGGIFEPELFWSCTTCMACVSSCPVGINHLEHIMEARRYSVMMEGKAPSEAISTLKSLQTSSTPVSFRSDKGNFFEKLGVKIINKGDTVDYLLWVGCISVGDKRKEKILESVVKIMTMANLNFGVLGDAEVCTGDPARRLGDETTAQMLSSQVRDLLRSVNFNTLVTHCPHCANAFLRDYPKEDRDFKIRVLHHSQLINELVKDAKLNLNKNFKTFVIHDPCYLARYLNVIEDQRGPLIQIGSLKEPIRSKERTFCCGAGGGQYFYDLKLGERINSVRARELLEVKADVIITMCPFCNQMISDGVGIAGDSRPVMDIAEAVVENLTN